MFLKTISPKGLVVAKIKNNNMAKETDNYSAFNGLNLSNARGENEPYKVYKLRLKQNEKIMKLYNTVGRDAFKELFPAGVHESMKGSAEEAYNENNPPKKKINKSLFSKINK